MPLWLINIIPETICASQRNNNKNTANILLILANIVKMIDINIEIIFTVNFI